MPYQDKQLKKEFITVDNRTIPFGYPQFWGGDDWEVSGRDNPLPVANYTRNEQGLWVPVSNENPVPTQLTGSNIEVARGIYDQTISVASGSSLSIKIEPPANEVWKLRILRINIPPITNATTGNHRLIVSVGTIGSDGAFLDISSAYNKGVFIISNKAGADNINIDPNWVMQAIQETYVSKNVPLYLYYANASDTDIENTNILLRIARLVYKK